MKKITITAAALILAAVIAMPAFAAGDWNFYGSARISTFVKDIDNKPGVRDTKNLEQALQGNARIGATVKASDGVTGCFEYGASDGNANVRKLYGQWDFGSGTLLIGQDYTPMNFFYSNQVYDTDDGLGTYGGVATPRKPMIQLSFGNFKIAAISPETDTLNVANADTETTIPKIEASFTHKFDNAFVDAAAGYNTYSVTDTATGIENDITSYVLAIGGGITFDRYYINADVFMGQNIGPYGLFNAPDNDPVVSGNTVIDNDVFGYLLVFGAKINDMFSIEAGYGYTEAELDSTSAREDGAESYYIQSTITLAPGVFLVPEIGIRDNKTDKTGADESDIVYYGAKWQINF